MRRQRKPVTQVILDLNGTLADTKGMITRTRTRLLTRLSRLLDVPEAGLVVDFRDLLDGNSFNPDIVENLPATRRLLTSPVPEEEPLAQALREEAVAFRMDVVGELAPHPGVRETLERLAGHGVALHVWSDGRSPFVRDFVRLLGFDGLLDAAYCPAAKPGVASSLDALPLERTRVVEFEHEARKPNPALLRRILGDNPSAADETLLVGNNPTGDGLSTVGTAVRFVHSAWGTSDAETEAQLAHLTKRAGVPDAGATAVGAHQIAARLERSLEELYDHFRFGAAPPRR